MRNRATGAVTIRSTANSVRLRLPVALLLAAASLSAQATAPDPAIRKMLAQVSPDRIGATVKTLVAFGTRGNYSVNNAPARKWIFDQLHGYSPRLEVSLDSGKQGSTDIVNVVAVLRGMDQPEKRIIVSGHYDTINLHASGASEATAPGADDDASGTAVVLELARVMSQYRFRKTIVFIAFGGEELGLVGSTRYANRAKAAGEQIEAVFNNDIVGTNSVEDPNADLAGTDNDIVSPDAVYGNILNIYSPDPPTSPSRRIAKLLEDAAHRYVPGIRIEQVARAERFGRGGDHLPFQAAGYPAVRVTSGSENTDVQHTAQDTADRVSPPFIAEVARINGAAIAALAQVARN